MIDRVEGRCPRCRRPLGLLQRRAPTCAAVPGTSTADRRTSLLGPTAVPEIPGVARHWHKHGR